MSEVNGEKQQLLGRSPTFWAVATVGVGVVLVGMLICGLLAGVGLFSMTRYLASDPVIAEGVKPEAIEAAPASATEATESETDMEVTEAATTELDDMADEEKPVLERGAPPPKVGNLAANFTLQDLEGKVVSLSDFKGQPVIINFWATWCGPCEAEMPDIHQAYLKHKADGLVVLAVDMAEHPDTVRSFINYYELTFTILLDRGEDVGRHYGARALPTTYFVDPAGTIVHVYFGQMDEQAIEIGLGKILPQE